MQTEDKFLVTNIRRYLGSDNPKLGEDRLIQQISEFSCPKNPDVEHFLKKNAIEFTKKSQSVTYLVFSLSSMKLVGYFTIALSEHQKIFLRILMDHYDSKKSTSAKLRPALKRM